MEKKKLELKKQTIVDLSDAEALQIKGGTTAVCEATAAIVTNLACAITVGLCMLTASIAIRGCQDYNDNRTNNTCKDCDDVIENTQNKIWLAGLDHKVCVITDN